jgi:hypothetical protein
MRGDTVTTMVDTSRWDQSFVDVDCTSRQCSVVVVSRPTHNKFEFVKIGIGADKTQLSTNCCRLTNNCIADKSNNCCLSAIDTRQLQQHQSSLTVDGSLHCVNNDYRIYENTSLSITTCPEPTQTRQTTSAVAVCPVKPARSDCSDQSQLVSSNSSVKRHVDVTYSQVASFLPAWDIERLDIVYKRLAVCGFYFGAMSIDEATERLSHWPVGSFLLRDSSDSRFLFSVSIQTCRGTTSIRVAYKSGLFRLDCSADQQHLMPTFDCVLRLVSHYVRLCQASASRKTWSRSTSGSPSSCSGHSYVLLESSGRRDTPVLLTTPCKPSPTSLAQLCRTTIHSRLNLAGHCASAVDRLQLIPSLKSYLKDYPYDL